MKTREMLQGKAPRFGFPEGMPELMFNLSKVAVAMKLSLPAVRFRAGPTPSLCLWNALSDGFFFDICRERHFLRTAAKDVTFHELSKSIERFWWVGELSPERDGLFLDAWNRHPVRIAAWSSFFTDFFIVHFSIFEDLSYSNFFMLSNKRKTTRIQNVSG